MIPKELAETYARIKGVSMETAYKNLEANMRKESEGIDLAQQYQALIKAFRVMSPQLTGVVQRETDMANQVASLKSEVRGFKSQISELEELVDHNTEIFKKAIKVIAEQQLKQQEVKPSLLARLVNRIKCLLKA